MSSELGGEQLRKSQELNGPVYDWKVNKFEKELTYSVRQGKEFLATSRGEVFAVETYRQSLPRRGYEWSSFDQFLAGARENYRQSRKELSAAQIDLAEREDELAFKVEKLKQFKKNREWQEKLKAAGLEALPFDFKESASLEQEVDNLFYLIENFTQFGQDLLWNKLYNYLDGCIDGGVQVMSQRLDFWNLFWKKFTAKLAINDEKEAESFQRQFKLSYEEKDSGGLMLRQFLEKVIESNKARIKNTEAYSLLVPEAERDEYRLEEEEKRLETVKSHFIDPAKLRVVFGFRTPERNEKTELVPTRYGRVSRADGKSNFKKLMREFVFQLARNKYDLPGRMLTEAEAAKAEREIKDDFVELIQSTKDRGEIIKLIKIMAEAELGDYFLEHFLEFGFTSAQKREVLLVLAKEDAAAMEHYFDQLPLKEMGVLEAVTMLVAEGLGGNLSNLLEKKNLDQEQATDLILDLIERDPFKFLENSKTILATAGEEENEQVYFQAVAKSWPKQLETWPKSEVYFRLRQMDFSRSEELEKVRQAEAEKALRWLMALVEREVLPEVKNKMASESLKEDDNWDFSQKFFPLCLQMMAGAGIKGEMRRDVLMNVVIADPELRFRVDSGAFPLEKSEALQSRSLSYDAGRMYQQAILANFSAIEKFEWTDLFQNLEDNFFSPRDAAGEELFEAVMEKMLRHSTGEGVMVQLLMTEYLADKYKRLIVGKILESGKMTLLTDATGFEKIWNGIMAEAQRLKMIEYFLDKNPVQYAAWFGRCRLTDKKKEVEIINKFIEQGAEPFCFCAGAAEAISVFSLPNPGQLFSDEASPTQKKMWIKQVQALRTAASPKTWKMLQMDNQDSLRGNYESGNFLELSLEQIKLLNILVEELPEIFVDKKGKMVFGPWFRLIRSCRLEQLDIIKQKYKGAKQYYRELYNAAYPFQVRKKRSDKAYGMNNLKEGQYKFVPWGSQNFFLILQLSVALNKDFGSVHAELEKTFIEKRVNTADKNVYWDYNYEFLPILAESKDQVAAYLFITKHASELKRVKEKLESDDFDLSHRERISILASYVAAGSAGKDFLENVMLEGSFIPGWDKSEALKLYLGFCQRDKLILFDRKDFEIFKGYIQVFGLLASEAMYQSYKMLIVEKKLTPELAALGLEETGESGLKKLKEKFEELKVKAIMTPKFKTADFDLNNPLVVDMLKVVFDFETSAWRRDIDFVAMLKKFEQDREAGAISKIPKEFNVSLVKIETLAEKFEVADGAKGRMKWLMDQARLAADSAEQEELDFEEQQKQDCLLHLGHKVRELKDQLASAEGQEVKMKALNDQLEKIKQLLEEVREADDLLKVLIQYEVRNNVKAVTEYTTFYIQRLSFYKTFKSRPQTLEQLNGMKGDQPQKDDLEKMVELINNVMKQHVFPELGLTSREIKRLMKSLNTIALGEEINRLNSMGGGGFQSLLFVPSRDVAAELSGYYSDACWTSKDSIMKDNPKMSAITFVQNHQDKEKIKLAGSTLLIESSVGGEPVLIIRGLNPKQNIITRLKAESFVKALLDYLEPICRQRGIKRILIPGDGRAGAMTNRPAIADYILREMAAKVNLDEPCVFNGYDITSGVCLTLRGIN